MATYKNPFPPVTMNELVKKVRETSNGALKDCWHALDRVDLSVPYSMSNPEISMLDWMHLVKSEMDKRGLIQQAARQKGEQETTYSLLVSNVGWIFRDMADYTTAKKRYDSYAQSGDYSQVTLWSSDSDDPIEECYTDIGETD